MTSQRIQDFAKVLVERAAEIEEGENVYLLSKSVESKELFDEVRRQIIQKGAYPHEHFVYDSQISSEGLDYDWVKHGSMEQMKNMSEAKLQEMQKMDTYIRIGGGDNEKELAGLHSEKISARKEATQDILTERLDKRWVTTRYPTDAMAQEAGMPTQEFRDFVIEAVTEVDWEALEEKNAEIKEVFDGAEEVRIEADDTELTLSLEGREGVCDNGDHNIPAGEVFYAPIKESLEGHIKFTYPGIASGNEVSGIYLEFENGKVVDYSAEKNKEYLEKMLDTDEGAKRVGELGIGTNRQITDHIKNTLFDEKIGGTIHLALGRAYEECAPEDVRNQSGIHWDIVKELRNGGKIFVDGELVQENGEWVFQ